MTLQRVSTYSLHQSTLGDVTRVQSNIAQLQQQISSGKKTDRFDGLGSQVEHFVSLEEKIARAQNYTEKNSLILARVNTTRVVLDDIIELVDDMEDLVLAARSGAASGGLNYDVQMNAMRDRFSEMLNTSFEGRYIFGGTRTNAPPIGDNPATSVPGFPDSFYYEGSSEDVVARLDDNIEINYGVRADADGFQKVFAALTLTADDPLPSDAKLEDAYILIQDGIEDLISEQTRVSSNMVAIENINVRHQELELYWKGITESAINTDIVAVSTELAIDQTVLQAAFQSFASLNRLRLVDFL